MLTSAVDGADPALILRVPYVAQCPKTPFLQSASTSAWPAALTHQEGTADSLLAGENQTNPVSQGH